MAKTEDGLLMVNLFESEERSDAMRSDPQVDEAIQSSGMPPPQIRHYELVQYETP